MKLRLFFAFLVLSHLLLSFIEINAQNFNWAIGIGGADRQRAEGGSCIATDVAGNTYIAGEFFGTADFNPGSGSAFLSPIITADGSDRSVFLAKYDANGKYIWAKVIVCGGNSYARGLAVGSNGKVVVVGNHNDEAYYNLGKGIDTIKNTGSYTEVFIAQFDSIGNYEWLKEIKSDDPNVMYAIEPTGGVAVDVIGNIYISGFFMGAIDFDPGTGVQRLSSTAVDNTDCFMAKYDINGNYVWAKGIGAGAKGHRIAVDTMDSQNNIYMIGLFSGTVDFNPGTGVNTLVSVDGTADLFIAKYDSNGNYIWANGIGGALIDYGQALSITNRGDICVTGFFMGTVDFDPGPDTAIITAGLAEVFIAKYDKDGNYIWAKHVEGMGAMSMGVNIGSDKLENVYVSGLIVGTSGGNNFDPGTDTALLYVGGMMDAFIAKYDACGNYTWAGKMGGSNGIEHVSNYGISVSPKGEVWVAGDFNATANFDPTGTTELLSTATDLNSSYIVKLTFNDTPSSLTYISVDTCSENYVYNDIVYTSSGEYTQLMPGATRCDSIVVLKLALHPELDKPAISVNDNTLSVVESESYVSFQWLKTGNPIAGAIRATYLVTENGTYSVRVSNENGCEATSDDYVVNNANAVENIDISNQITVYPNPTKGTLYIVSSVAVNASLYTIEGHQVLTEKNVTELSLENLAKGVYLLQITDTNAQIIKTKKIVVE